MRTSIIMLSIMSLAAFIGGCGDGSSNNGTGECAPAAFDIAGTFNERYTCRSVESGDCAGVDVSTQVIIAQSTNGVDYTFENIADVSMGSGQLCGNEFIWTSTGEGFTEMGVWTFSDADNVSIASMYTESNGEKGECVGVATTGADPGPPPALPCNAP